jgi:ectoine hydroxylase-related dioxygenase (phytanoyl-CoA dioxygenase family)
MILQTKSLSKIDRYNYQQNGYIVVPNLVSPAVIETIRHEMRSIFLKRLEVLSRSSNLHEKSLYQVMQLLFQTDEKSYLAAAKLTQYLPSIHALGCLPALSLCLKDLGLHFPVFSTRPVCHFASHKLQITGGYNLTPPHQDWRSVQGSLDSVVVWIPLQNVGTTLFPLEIIPGSHHYGLFKSEEDIFGHRVAPDQISEDDFITLDLKEGDVLIFSQFLVHKTGDGTVDDVRIALSYRFNNAAEATFIERNYPNPYIYKPDLTLITPDFPERVSF